MTPKRMQQTGADLVEAMDAHAPDIGQRVATAVIEGFDPYQPIRNNLICMRPPSVCGDFVMRLQDASFLSALLNSVPNSFDQDKDKKFLADLCAVLPGRQGSPPVAGTLVGDPASGEVPEQFRKPRVLNLLEVLPYMDNSWFSRDDKFDAVMTLLDTSDPVVRAQMALAIPSYFKLMQGDGWTSESALLCMAKMINAGADLDLLAQRGQRLEFNCTNLLIWIASTTGPQHKHFKDAARLEIMEDAAERLLALEPGVREKLFDLDFANGWFGDTALINAVEMSSTKMVGMLLDAGADMMKKHRSKRRNKVRVSAYTLAQHLRRSDVVEMMDAVKAQRAIRTTLVAAFSPPGARPTA